MSIKKTITLNDHSELDFNELITSVSAAGVSLIKRVLPLVISDALTYMYLATGRLQQDADAGSYLSVFLKGNASWDNVNGYDCSNDSAEGLVSLNDDSLRDGIVPLMDISHFNFKDSGTVSFKFTPSHDEAVVGDRYIFTTGSSIVAGGRGSLISLFYLNGNLVLEIDNITGSSPVSAAIEWTPVIGQEFDIEVSIDGVNYLAVVFIDGVALITSPLSGPVGDRDYFYLGGYFEYTPSYLSSGKFKDLQIYDNFLHVENFGNEVPKVANIYPIQSLVRTYDRTLMQDFISLSDDQVTPGDAKVNYVIRIDEVNYWVNLLNELAVSDGTYLESNTKTEINSLIVTDLLDAFISKGKSVSFSPVLYSGQFGLYNPELLTNEIEYKTLLSSTLCNQCKLTGKIKDNCEDVQSGAVKIYTKRPILTQGSLVTVDETVSVELPSGKFEVDIIIPNIKKLATSTSPAETYETRDLLMFEAHWIDFNGDEHSYKRSVLIPDQSLVSLAEAVELANN